MDYNKKQESLKKLRQDIKKKRFLLDETKDKFGLDDMVQLKKVTNDSEIKGYPFKGYYKSGKIALKVIPIETKYNKHEHPCNIEGMILKEVTDNLVRKCVCPHFVNYLGTSKLSNRSRTLKMLNLKKLEIEDKIRSQSLLLVSEYISGGGLDSWIFETYENDKKVSDIQWKVLVFQLVYTIYVMQTKYKMMHNDFHYGNILIDDSLKAEGYIVYKCNSKTYYIPNTGIMPKLMDFEFGMVYSKKIEGMFPNKFITGPYTYDYDKNETIIKSDVTNDSDLNVPYNYNEVYDLHYFMISLLDLFISQELFDYILSIYPEEVIPESSDSSSDNSSDSSSDNSSESSSDSSSDNSSESSSDTLSESSSDTLSESSSDTLSESSSENEYIKDGRLINGSEKIFNLPKPLDVLESEFFKCFLEKPSDFDESKCLFFELESIM